MSGYQEFDIGLIDTVNRFPRGPYEQKWARQHKNFVFAFMLSSVMMLATTIVLLTSNVVGNTAHVLYPVTTDLSYETVELNYTTDGDLIVYYNRQLEYKVVGYLDVVILFCVSVGLDVIYYVQVMYTVNFHLHQVPIISTVSIWKWINYGLSGGVMLFICALVVGVNDLLGLSCIEIIHIIISGLFYVMERRNANLLRRYKPDGERIPAEKKKVKWLYVIFPTFLLAVEFMLLIVYFVYLLVKSNGIGHIWFNVVVFFISQVLFVTLAVMTAHTYYVIATTDDFRFSMMIPRAVLRMLVTFLAKIAMFVCIVFISATDLPLSE